MNLYLETQKEEENKTYFDLGIKNFCYNISSKILLTETQKDKIEDANLIKRLSSKLNFIDSEELIQSKIEKEIEAQNNLSQSAFMEDTSETDDSLGDLQRRKLWEGEFDFNWPVLNSNILGQAVKIGYFVELDDGKIKNYLRIEVGCCSSISFGNERGLNYNKKDNSENKDGVPVGKIPLGTLFISLTIKLGSSLAFGVVFDKNDIFRIQLEGRLYISAGVEFGVQNVASIEAGVRGDFVNVVFSTAIRKQWNLFYVMDRANLKVCCGKVSVYVTARVWIWIICNEEFEVYRGDYCNEYNW